MTIAAETIEQVVDAVGDALGVDTGNISEARFQTALQAATEVLCPPLPPKEPMPFCRNPSCMNRVEFADDDLCPWCLTQAP